MKNNRRCIVLVVGLALMWTACAHRPNRKERETSRVNYDLGISAFEHGDAREAMRALMLALKHDPQLPEAHHALGLVLHSLGRKDDALKHYQEALRLRPRFSEAYNNMGVLLLDTEQYDAAIAAFEKALEDVLYQTPTLAEGNLGWAYYKKGDVTLAREHIQRALTHNPQFCRGYEWMMRIALNEGEGALAVSQGKKFQHHCLGQPQIAESLSPGYRRQMDYFLALGHLKIGQRQQALGLLQGCALTSHPAPGDDASVVLRCRETLEALE